MIESRAVTFAERAEFKTRDRIGIQFEQLPISLNRLVPIAGLPVACCQAFERRRAKVRSAFRRRAPVEWDRRFQISTHLLKPHCFGQGGFGDLSRDAFARPVGHAARRRDLKRRSGFQTDAVWPELLPIRQFPINGARRQFRDALQAIPNLLVRRAAILVERTQAECEQDDARQNDHYGKSSQHVSNVNPRRWR